MCAFPISNTKEQAIFIKMWGEKIKVMERLQDYVARPRAEGGNLPLHFLQKIGVKLLYKWHCLFSAFVEIRVNVSN